MPVVKTPLALLRGRCLCQPAAPWAVVENDLVRMIAENPAALELRRMQMISEVGAEQNTTTVIMMPSEFVTLARGITQFLERSPSSN